jgi:hypothetical protein
MRLSAMVARVVVFPYWRRALNAQIRLCSTPFKNASWPFRSLERSNPTGPWMGEAE